MKLLTNLLGTVLILGIAVLVLSRLRSESAYHVSTQDLQISLLAALPEKDRIQAHVSVVKKAGTIYVSTTFQFTEARQFENMINELKNQKWREIKTPLMNTRIFCRGGAVYKVVATGVSSGGSRHYLETSSGDYHFYCGGG